MTYLLAIDASAPRSAVAVGKIHPDEGATLLASEERVDGANQASQSLDTRIREQLELAGIGLQDLDMFGCGRGPGTFTGTRVAVATMQGLSVGSGLPVLGIGTLEALAHSLDGVEAGDWVLPLLDARRGEVYAQLFEVESVVQGEAQLRPRSEPACAPLQASLDALTEHQVALDRVRALGPGVAPYADALPPTARPSEGPTGAGLWRACVAAVRRGQLPLPAESLSALYLRATYAELGLNKPKRPVFKSPLL